MGQPCWLGGPKMVDIKIFAAMAYFWQALSLKVNPTQGKNMEKSAPKRCQLDAVLPSVSQENLQSRTAGISGLDASEIHRFFFTVAVPNTSNTSTKQG